MIEAYIGLGANIGDPELSIKRALKLLDHSADLYVSAVSSLYQSPALTDDNKPQPDYLNAVAKVYTSLRPLDLLAQLQFFELQLGRERHYRWSPRTMDLDLLLYEDVVMDTDVLTLPHREMLGRDFVMYPLHEIAPDLMLPNQQYLRHLILACPDRGLKIVGELVVDRFMEL